MEPFKFKYLRGSFAKNRSLLFVLIFLKHVWCLQSEEYQSNWSGMVVRAWVGSGSGLYFSSTTTTRAGFIVRQWKWPTNAPGNKMWRAASSSWWPRCKCKGTNGGAPARNALHVFHPPARWKGENGASSDHCDALWEKDCVLSTWQHPPCSTECLQSLKSQRFVKVFPPHVSTYMSHISSKYQFIESISLTLNNTLLNQILLNLSRCFRNHAEHMFMPHTLCFFWSQTFFLFVHIVLNPRLLHRHDMVDMCFMFDLAQD